MENVINQLIKTAAYHAISYDKTVQALDSLNRIQTEKTAALDPAVMNAILGGGLGILGGALFNHFDQPIINSQADEIAKLQAALGSANDQIAAGGKAQAALQSELDQLKNMGIGDKAKALMSDIGDAAGAKLDDAGAAVMDLVNRAKGYGQQGLDALSDYGRQGMNAVKGYGQQGMDALKGYGQQALGAVKAHPYIAGGTALATGLGAALPALMGSKEGSYHGYVPQYSDYIPAEKLAMYRQALLNM